MAWLDSQWNEPSRTDYYLMQVAREVKRVLSSKPASVKLLDFKLPFGEEAKPTKPTDKQIEAHKATWIGRLGGKVIRKFKSKA